MKKISLVCLLMLTVSTLFCQSDYGDDAKSTLGVGFGLDYGGIGFKFTQLIDPHFGFTLGGGYALAGFGYNVGGLVKIKPENRVVPTFSFMYGYNAAVAVTNATQLNKIFYGPSLGFGFLSKRRNNPSNYWQFELVLPIRSGEADSYINGLRNMGVSIGSLSPVAFSIGYNFGL
jgi:hypothetical protein